MIVTGLAAEPIDAPALVDRIRSPECGGLVVFEGSTRSPNGGAEVVRLEYEAYTERAERQLRALAEEARERFGVHGVVALHRTGVVPAGETSVLVACSSPHRAEAFDAARWLIDAIKSDVAIWKQEHLAGGARVWTGVEDV